MINVTKAYGETLAVDDLSFSVKPGIVTGFLGPNGAGKSTTMRMILGADAQTSGTATVAGHQRSDHDLPLTPRLPARRRRRPPHRSCLNCGLGFTNPGAGVPTYDLVL